MVRFKLSNIETEEVSLVPKGANNKKFFLIKSADGDKVVSMSGLIEKFMDQVKEEKVLDGVEPEIDEVARVAKHLIQTIRDLVPEGTANQFFQSLLKENKGEKTMDKVEGKEIETPEAKKDEGAKAPEATPAEGTGKPAAEAVEKAVIENVELRKELDTLQKKFKESEDVRVTKEFIEEAKQFKNLSINAEQFGPVLKSVKESAPKAYDKIVEVLKSAEELLRSNEVMKAQGSDAKHATGSAWEKIEKMADAMIEKSSKPLKKTEAIDIVLKSDEGKKLYNQYEVEGGKA